MKKFRLSITEEIGGYIEVNAQDATHAETLVEDLLDEYGADRLFYPIPEDKQVLSKYTLVTLMATGECLVVRR